VAAPEQTKKLVPEESKVGKKLSDLTTKRLIIVVLAMLFSVPVFDTATFITPPTSYTFGLELMAAYQVGSDGFNMAFDYYVQEEVKTNTPLILVSALNYTWDSFLDVSLFKYLHIF
jgi:hypothetical protein